MTRSIVEARFQIEARLVALAAGTGRAPLIEAVEAVRAEDGAVLVYAHLSDTEANGGMPLTACMEWGSAVFDEAQFVEAFWRAGPPSVARN